MRIVQHFDQRLVRSTYFVLADDEPDPPVASGVEASALDALPLETTPRDTFANTFGLGADGNPVSTRYVETSSREHAEMWATMLEAHDAAR